MPPPATTTRTDLIAAAYASHLHTWTGVPNPAGVAAYQLQAELWQTHRISADVHHGDRVALVSVATGLVCWTDGVHCWWWTGRTSPQERPVYTYLRATDVVAAARRVAARYAELCQSQDGTGPAAVPVGRPRPLAEVSTR